VREPWSPTNREGVSLLSLDGLRTAGVAVPLFSARKTAFS
jgi:hypothetical protein